MLLVIANAETSVKTSSTKYGVMKRWGKHFFTMKFFFFKGYFPMDNWAMNSAFDHMMDT